MNIRKQVLKVFMFIFLASVMIVPAKAVQFSDLAPNHWGYEKVMEFVQKGYMKGYEDNTFKPDGSLTRAEFVHVINNYFGFTGNENVITTLSDVEQNEWYAKGVNEAVARGYMVGYEDGTFRPNNPITRQEAIVVLAKILNLNDNTSSEIALEYLKAKYSDYNTIEPWALNAMYNFSKLGYINGYEDGTLRSGICMTRTEVVHMISPVEQKIVIEEKPSKGGGSGGGSSSGGSSSTITYYTITVNATENGTVIADATRVEKGKNVTVTVTPAIGYELAELLDNGQVATVVDGVYTITNVQANHIISATFSLIPVIPEEPVVKYTITVTSNEKGEAISDVTEVEEGETAKVALTPGKAYRLYTLTDNGVDVTENVVNGVYTIANVQENHEVVATFGCNCEECIAELIEVLKEIADVHVDLLVEKLEAAKGDAEAIRTEIEAVLGEKIENSEYKEEIEALIEELKAVDYKGLSVKALAVLGKIVTSETAQNAFEKIESLVPAEQKEELKALLNKIEEKINAEVDNAQIEIEDFIENHDCEEVQSFVAKLINKLESIDSMEELINEIKKYIKANVPEEEIEKAIEALIEKYNYTVEELKSKLQESKDKIVEEITNRIVKAKEYQEKIEEAIEQIKSEIKDALPTEAELKEMAEELLAKGEATLETLKEKLEEKIAEREEKIQEVIEQIKAEIKENLPTEEELREMAEELLAKNQAKLETLKEKLIAKLKGELEDVEDKWNDYLEQIKDQIASNLPTEEIFNDLISKIDSLMPQIEEMTGIDFSDIAAKLGIEADTVSEAIEAITQNEALKELIVDTLKDKVSDLIANELSNNDTVKDVLNKVYDATEKDVVDAIVELSKKDTTGITVKIILSNTELSDVLDAIDEDITDEDLKIVVKACVDYYGLAEFIQEVDSCLEDDSAKELIKIALKNANAEELVKLVGDNKTQEIILNYLGAEEIIEVLGDVGKEILGDKLEDILGGSIEEALTFTTVTYNGNAKNVSGKTKDSTHNKFFGVKLTSNGFEREGYTFKGWATSKNGNVEYEDGESVKSTAFNATEVTLYAVWEANIYEITSWADENGNSVTAKSTATTDEEVQLTVTAKEWYEVVEIKVNGTKVTGNSFVMPACDVEITAIFVYTYVEPTAHTITVGVMENGKVIPNVTSAIKETEVTITVSPDTGYELETLVVNTQSGEITVIDNKFTMPDEEVTITATFVAVEFDVIVEDTDLATVTASLEKATVEDTVTITVIDIEEGYELVRVTANGDSLEGENGIYTFDMPAKEVTIEADFELKTYGYTLSIDGEGSVYVISEDELKSIRSIDDIKNLTNVDKIKYTDEIYVVCIDDVVGFDLESVIITGATNVSDGALLGVSYKKIEMPANDVDITVEFVEVDTYTITVIDAEGGEATVSTTEAEENARIYIEVDAEEGYTLKSCKVTDLDDKTLYDLTKALTKDFKMPAEDVKVVVEFVDIYPITVAGGAKLVAVSEIPKINSILDIVGMLLTAKVGESKYGEDVYVFSLDDIKVDGLSIKLNDFDISVEDMNNNQIEHTDDVLSIKGMLSTYNIPYKTFTMPDGPVTITKQ